MRYYAMIYAWNSNGTNDIEIMDSNFNTIDGLDEALFGFNIDPHDTYNHGVAVVPVSKCLDYVAVSPVSDGSDTVQFLKQYCK